MSHRPILRRPKAANSWLVPSQTTTAVPDRPITTATPRQQACPSAVEAPGRFFFLPGGVHGFARWREGVRAIARYSVYDACIRVIAFCALAPAPGWLP